MELTNRMIAERLGWTVSVEPLSGTTTLWEPNFTQHTTWGLTGFDVAELGAKAWEGVPDYLHDVNIALTLVARVPGTFVLQSAADGIWQAWFGTPAVPQATADTPAKAICEAWLKWHDDDSHF